MAAETIIIPLPEGFTKVQAFEMLAETNGYEPLLTVRTPKIKEFKKTASNNPKELSEAFIAGMDGKTMIYGSILGQPGGGFAIQYILVSEIPNPEKKVDFGKKQFGNVCKDIFNQVVIHVAKKELLEQAEQAGKTALEEVSFEGLEIN